MCVKVRNPFLSNNWNDFIQTCKQSTEDSFWIHESFVKGIAELLAKLTSN